MPQRASPTPNPDAERVIRHRISGHQAALDLADAIDRPDLLAAQVEETEHRLAEDEDILDEIAPNNAADSED